MPELCPDEDPLWKNGRLIIEGHVVGEGECPALPALPDQTLLDAESNAVQGQRAR
jgi:hypothetical protein